MRQLRTFASTGFLALLLSLAASSSRAGETKVPIDQLPKSVAAAVKEKFPGADLQKASKEDADGQTVFEVSLKHKGQRYDVSVSAEGKIVEIERQIGTKDLPPEVSKALDQKYAKATIKVAEEITKGEIVSYEVLLVTVEKKTIEVVLDGAGKILEEEQKEDDEEDEIAIDQLPKAVLDAIKKKFPDAELVGAEKESEDGNTIYEVALKFMGAAYDVSAKADGTIVEVEKAIAAKDLPAAVSKSLDQKYPNSTIKKAEEITKDKDVTYKVLLVSKEMKTLEVVLDPAGKVLEEDADDEDED